MARGVKAFCVLGTAFAAAAANADSAPAAEASANYADPDSVIVAARADFAPPGGAVRFVAFDEATFLEEAAAKGEAVIGEDGLAVVALKNLQPGAYAFVAYYDRNGDGKLNRGRVLGKPKEPFAFSNGVRPKLRKPRFEEAKVDVAPGAVIVLTIPG
jgi:uncharacterized protein (DUF2141 family)